MGRRNSGIAKFHAGDEERGTLDVKFLDVAFGERIGEQLVFNSHVELVRGQQIFHGIRSLIHDRAGFGKSAVEEGSFFADGVAELAVGKPRNIVEVNGNSRSFFQLECYREAVGARLEVVVHFGEHAGLQQTVCGGLQFCFSDLGAFFELSERDDLGFGKSFQALRADLVETCGRWCWRLGLCR